MNVIIVGAGLSGICIAHELEKHNIPYQIIDKNKNYSTRVAGGMINPMTFRRMIKTWKGDELLPTIAKYYPEIEKKVGERFFFPIKIRRIFSTPEEQKMWEEKVDDNSYLSYLSSINKPEETPPYITNKFGNGFVKTPGYIESKTFLISNQKYFKNKNTLINADFDYQALDTERKTYQGKSYTHLIFAEGFEGENNPYFNYLPFKNAKGETLTIQSRVINRDEILNRKCFILPTQDGNFRLGSTYSWGTKDPSPTEAAKEELINNYLDLSSAAMEILNHQAGIRPTAMDRRPMIGEHPEHKGLYFFNGMGAKGFMIAPYFAIQFVKFLQGKEELEKEVDIKRFYTRFYQKG